MGTYRLEEAPSSRAGCQNKECKDQKVKIQKGELRIGTWVESEKFQSFVWRHWGCVTPKMIQNIVQSLEDAGMEAKELDGFDELSEESQEKVLKGIEAGHVDDADWKGDVEMNRPGKTGYRVRRASKKDANGNAEAKAEANEPEEKPKSKKRSAKADAGQGDEEAPTAKKTKKRSRAKKPASDDEVAEAEAESEQDKPALKKSRASKASAKAERPARKQRQKKSAEDEDGGQELVEEQPKRRGRKRAVKSD